MRSPRSSKRIMLLAAALAVAAASGCAAPGPAAPTEREQAQKRWGAARANVLVSLAKDQYRTAQFDKARQTVDEALRLSPENAQGHLVSARLHIEKGQLESAERELAAARTLTPNDGEPYYLSGVVLQRWQKHEAAHDMYKAAAEKSPGELAYLLARAEALVTLDRTEEALTLLESKAEYFEHSGTIRDAVGQLQVQRGRYVDAVRSFRQASVLSEDEPAIKERLARAQVLAGQQRDAVDVLVRLVATEGFAKRADLFALLGECQLSAGQAREARFSFETSTSLDATSPSAWRGLGRAALEANDLRRAELAITKAAKLDPDQSQGQLLLGYLRVRQERWDDAVKAFEAAAALDPADVVAVCMVGYAHEKRGEPDLAAKFYTKAVRLRPQDEMARRLLAGLE